MFLTKAWSMLRGMVRESAPYRAMILRRRFPGLLAHPSTTVSGSGEFRYAAGCTVGEGTVIHIAEAGTLSMAEGASAGRFVELCPVGRIQVGRRTSLQDRCIVIGEVEIGGYCLLAPNVYISSSSHHWRDDPPQPIRDQDAAAQLVPGGGRPVRIEEDCWIGINVVIMPGVTIGRGCVVGANTVVTRDLPPYAVAVGSPARIIRSRLQFAPPPAIDARNGEHLPYFYRGFLLMRDERSSDGLRCGRRFAIRLAHPPGHDVLRLRVRPADAADGPLSLRHGAEVRNVPAQGGDCSFTPAPGADGIFELEVEGGQAAAPLVIAHACLAAAAP